MSLMGLAADNARYHAGEIRLDGENLLALDENAMRKRRWKSISMVFQGAMNSWNPVYTVGDQIREAIDLHFDPRLQRGRIEGPDGSACSRWWGSIRPCSTGIPTSSPAGCDSER